jgi:hypothetical protein
MLFHNTWKNLFLLAGMFLAFCVFPAQGIAGKADRPMETPRIAVQPGIDADLLEGIEIDKTYFKEDVLDFENALAIPRNGQMAADSLRDYIISKQQFLSERDFETKIWSIAPLLGNHASSHPAVDMPIGVMLKLRF